MSLARATPRDSVTWLLFLSLCFPVFAAAQTAILRNNANSWVAAFEGGVCNINPCPDNSTITIPVGDSGSFKVYAQHDLVLLVVWCHQDCNVSSLSINSTPPVSIASGDIVQTSVQGSKSSAFGQARIYYIADAPAHLVGTHTLTLVTSGGTPPQGGTHVQYQVAYADFSVSSGYHFVHHLDSAYVTGTGPTVNKPSITAPGDLIVFFESPDGHTNSINSPWTTTKWAPDYFEATTNSSNGMGYIASGPGTAVAVNASVEYGVPSWGSMIVTFTPTTDSPPDPPTDLSATPR